MSVISLNNIVKTDLMPQKQPFKQLMKFSRLCKMNT